MNTTFDEGYARYLSFLAKLDKTDNIEEKNVLFRQLTAQLSELEQRLNSKGPLAEWEETAKEDADLTYWV